ncbi:MAG: L-asparaginase II [Ilumatobacter sp.]|jgi:L-asparaginase II
MTKQISGTRFNTNSFAPIAVATRNGTDESLYHGAGVVLGSNGSTTASIGDPELAIHPRSSLKPFQASAMVRLGLKLPHRLLAVVAASHSGEQQHLDAVSEILDQFGLSVDDFLNTPDRPYGVDAKHASIASGIDPSKLQQNCSGKHAGMLATCRVNAWALDSYLDPEHPLQQAITQEIDRLSGRAGGAVLDVGIDGCGAPTHVMALVDVARSLSTMLREGSDVVEAMATSPLLVGGSDRDVTLWMQAVPGLAAKEGAAGVMVMGLPDGRAAALKIADGSDLVRRAVGVELLRMLDVDVDGELSPVRDAVAVQVLGHGIPVGSLEPLRW